MNNKGFMMAEVIVVASIILVSLASLYASSNKIFSTYNQRIDYYDIATLYELANIRNGIDFNIENTSVDNTIYSTTLKKVYYIKKDELDSLSDSDDIHKTFKEYLEFISKSATIDADNILVMENCTDTDNCKYSYLEVFE